MEGREQEMPGVECKRRQRKPWRGAACYNRPMSRQRLRRPPLWQWCLTCLLLLALPLKGLAASGLTAPVEVLADAAQVMLDTGPCPHAGHPPHGTADADHAAAEATGENDDGQAPQPAGHCAPCCGGMALHHALVWRTEPPAQPRPNAGPSPHDASVTPARHDRPPTPRRA